MTFSLFMGFGVKVIILFEMAEEIYKLVGSKIRDYRREKGFTQSDLAEKTDTSTNYIGQIERGTKRPSLKTLKRIADILGTELRELFSAVSKNSRLPQSSYAFDTKRILYLLGEAKPSERKIILNLISSLARKKK